MATSVARRIWGNSPLSGTCPSSPLAHQLSPCPVVRGSAIHKIPEYVLSLRLLEGGAGALWVPVPAAVLRWPTLIRRLRIFMLDFMKLYI